MRRITFLALLTTSLCFAACGEGEGGENETDTAVTDTSDTSGADGTEDGSVDDASTDAGECAACSSSRDCTGGTVCVDGCCEVAPDTGTPDTGAGCGDVTFAGECEGNVARWCQDNTLMEIDCATDFLTRATCEFINDDFGFFCAVAPTAECVVPDSQGAPQPVLCTGTDPACSFTGEAYICVENVDGCVVDGFAPGCIGEFFAQNCNQQQVVGLDCGEIGGVCGGEGCEALPANGPCAETVLLCGPALDCVVDDTTGLGTCVAADPTCDDGVMNGDEEGIDCGGADCDACPDPTCEDGVLNGDEEGIDCGGESCDACEVEANCEDGLMNGDEEGIDCGGESCDACEVEANCEDGVMNGDETGVDCGGDTCDECIATATCEDGLMNGDEEGVDCGGASCDPCGM
ncbi:MAG: hypothetical protein ACI81R_000307 [Bradymonadia bacterium]